MKYKVCLKCGRSKGLHYYGQNGRNQICNYCKYQESRIAPITPKPKKEIFNKVCLKCENEFEARSKYNRICYDCRQANKAEIEHYNIIL